MLRRSSFARRLSLEALEVRCNPAALVSLASIITESAADVRGDATTDQYAPSNKSQDRNPSNSNAYFTNDYSLTNGTAASTPTNNDAAGASLSAFAGQTVRLRIAEVNNRDVVGGWGNDWISGGTGQDAPVGGQGSDVLIGALGADDASLPGGPTTSLVLTFQGDRLDPSTTMDVAATDIELSRLGRARSLPSASANGISTAQLNIVGTISDL